MKKLVALTLALCMIVSLIACGSQEKPAAPAAPAGTEAAKEEAPADAAPAALEGSYNFIVGSSSNEGSTDCNVFKKFVEDVKNETDGKMNITFYGASALGSDKEMITAMQEGTVTMVTATSAQFAGLVPEMAILDIPNAVHDMSDVAALFADPEFMETAQKWFEAAGFRLVAWDTTLSKVMASTKEIQSVEDFKGYDMRTLNNKYQIAYWAGLGANTIQIDASELYLSLQQGLIQGLEMSVNGIRTRNLNEVADYVVDTLDYSQFKLVVMNLDAYNSMSDADKAWFDQRMAALSEEYCATSAADMEADWKYMEDQGVHCLRNNDKLFDEMRAVAEEKVWPMIREDIGAEVFDFFFDSIARVTGK